MFTGIITDIGIIRSIEQRGDMRVVIGCSYEPGDIAMGASIACSGVCLTVVDKGTDDRGHWFAVDVSGETVSRTAQVSGLSLPSRPPPGRSRRPGQTIHG